MTPWRKRHTPTDSPFQYAQETVDHVETHGRGKMSRAWLSSAKRIVQLEHDVRRRLEAAKPTLALVRWVAWGESATTRQQRAALALHIRTTLDTAAGGWPADRELAAAMETWQAAMTAARARGVRPPRCSEIPAEDYKSAMAAVARSKKRAPRIVAVPDKPVVLSVREREALRVLLDVLPVLEGLLKQVLPNDAPTPGEGRPVRSKGRARRGRASS